MNKGIALIIAFLPALCMLVGLIVGFVRYKKYGAKIRERVEEEYAKKRAQGGIHELYHKRPDKRVVFETFGIPIYTSLAVGLLIVFLVFKFVR